MTNKQTQRARKQTGKQRDNARKQRRNMKQSGFSLAELIEPAQVDAIRKVVRAK